MGVPISALQRNAAEVVRRVAASRQSEEITDRGRVVAVIAPATRHTGLEALRQAGAVRPAKPAPRSELLQDITKLPSLDLPAALREQRDTER